MDTPIAGERVNEERAFVKRYTEDLASHKVEYPADFSTPLEDRPRKVPVVGVSIAEPPDVMDVDSAPNQDTSISLTVKSLKPSLSITVTAQLTDTVADLKALVAKSSNSAPPQDTQRLLLKGKALTDTKILREYDIESGSVIHLLLKPALAAAPQSPIPSPTPSHASPSDAPPSLTITTSIDTDSKPGTAMALNLTDVSAPPRGPQPQVSSAAFHNTIADPQFWQKIHALCVSEFGYEDDADSAWESFLVSMKGRLSAGEAAKIRDVVGVKVKRRHARQNKDIILENVNKKTIIKSVQDEIASLHVELREVRLANVVLHARVKRMHEDESRLGGQVRAKQVLFPSLSGHQSTRDALDLIFSAIPALKMLRDTLAASAPSRGPSANKSRSSGSLKIISNPTATRPAAAWAEAVGLGTVSEATEWGSDDGEDRKARRRSRGRRSGVGSVAASRSPLPFITRDRIPRDSLSALVILETGSPRSSASPSPHKQALGVPRSPHTEKKQKRRRESGLLRPRSRSATPETAEAGVLSDRVEVLTVPHIFEVSPPEGESIGSEQSTRHVRVKNIAGMLDPAQRVGTDALQLSNSEDSRIRSTKGTKRNIVREEPGLEDAHTSLPSYSPPVAPSPAPSGSAFTDDDPGRGRRSRKSVNYKEPSLTKKMRKPDGLAVDDAYDTKSGRTSFSGMSPLPFPSISEDLGTLQPLPPHHLTGLRRKSALPKAMSRLPASLDEDDEDEDLVDNLAALDEDENVPALVTPDVEEDGSDYLAVRSAAPLSSGSSSTQSEGRTPTPAPRHATSSPPLLALGATSGSHATRPQTRTSPRKGGASQPRSTTKYSTTPSLGGIKLSSGGSRLQAVAMAPSATHAMPVQRTRDALADLPSTNVLGVGKQKAGDYKGVGKLGGGEKRGRISSAVQMGISGS